MSGADTTEPQDGLARKIGLEAAAWIQRRDFDAWTVADQTALEAWLDETPAHRVAFYRLDFGWQRTSRLAALRPHGSNSAERQRTSGSKHIVRAAAVILVVGSAAVAGTWLSSQLNRTTYATPVGAHEILTLKDGSQIELNTDTVLQIAKSGATREVWLEKGEAYFQVVHDPAHPFLVNVGQRQIFDIGTKFVIRREDQNLRVAVSDGSVSIDSHQTGQTRPLILKAGDVAVANAGSVSVSVLKASRQALSEELGWRRGVLVFHHVSLAEAAERINRYGGKKLTIADSKIGRLVIGGTFPINNVMALAEAAQDLFGLHIENRGDEVVISR